jgi:hypothetical protein
MNLPHPDQFNQITEQSLYTWTMRKYGNDAQYQPGRPIPLISFELTQQQIDNLHHLKENRNFYVVDGVVNIPDGITVKDNTNNVVPAYLHWSALYNFYVLPGTNTVEERPIDVVRSVEWGNRVNSRINTPTNKRPVAELRNTYIQIMPKTVSFMRFEYLRHPLKPVWAYDMVSNRPVYNSVNSVDIDAPKEAQNEIAVIALSYLGINMREPELVQYAESMKDKGV